MKLKCQDHGRRVHVIDNVVYHRNAEFCGAEGVDIGDKNLSRLNSMFQKAVPKGVGYFDYLNKSEVVFDETPAERLLKDIYTSEELRDEFTVDKDDCFNPECPRFGGCQGECAQQFSGNVDRTLEDFYKEFPHLR